VETKQGVSKMSDEMEVFPNRFEEMMQKGVNPNAVIEFSSKDAPNVNGMVELRMENGVPANWRELFEDVPWRDHPMDSIRFGCGSIKAVNCWLPFETPVSALFCYADGRRRDGVEAKGEKVTLVLRMSCGERKASIHMYTEKDGLYVKLMDGIDLGYVRDPHTGTNEMRTLTTEQFLAELGTRELKTLAEIKQFFIEKNIGRVAHVYLSKEGEIELDALCNLPNVQEADECDAPILVKGNEDGR
jgi:hypothetical protein